MSDFTTIRKADIRRWERKNGEDFFDQFTIVNEIFLLGFLLSTGTPHFNTIKEMIVDEKEELSGVRSNLFSDKNEEAEEHLMDAIVAICNVSKLHGDRVREAFAETKFEPKEEGE